MPQTLTYRQAALEDLPALERLVNGAYRGERSTQGWTTEAHLLDGQRTDRGKLAEMLEPTLNQRIEIAFLPDEVSTLVACLHLKQEPPHCAYVGMLTVDPLFQSAGFGKQLLQHAESLARGWGSKTLRMTVIDRRLELIAYYERRGYAQTGKSEPFPADDPRFGIVKVQNLRLLELVKPL